MIKALVVDDEKRVRKGFISLADWSAYGMQIVGEAKDGPSAMDLLGRQEVDLMFVDISMPGMSGFELIEEARGRYPWTKSVILTCHHEFDYVQEALRIGAIDYIVKTLLNKSNVDETMQRIARRYAREAREPGGGTERAFRSAVVFCPLHPRAAAEAGPPLGAIGGRKIRRLGERLWMALLAETDGADWARELPSRIAGGWQAVQVNAAGGMPLAEAEHLLREHLPTYLFYALEPAGPVEIQALKPDGAPAEREIEAAFEEWKQLKWLVFGEDWRRFVERIERWRVDPDRLRRFAAETASAWSGYFGWAKTGGGGTGALPAEMSEWDRWKQWKSWLSSAALQVQQQLTSASFSREVFASLIRAVLYMKEHAGQELTQDEVARKAGMSRSYFSQCFKKFAGGEPFGDALRRMRIEQAQALLLHTGLPVRDIANRVGFEDEKYFSRVFRDKTGYLPTEFRQAAGGGG
ncbi:response regulator [Cohnella nanjingensis]|uniref:Response regulator n=1 Tax=Cohnella nanjingensis TaxID=1387779 RepID=A0A7X0RTF0_9BACL|nr:response regulator [Cohnella nanjingensis]MBB6673250.1 response regulator [Cohnella nanjingensis]